MRGQIDVSDVSFAYERDDTEVLHHVSLHVKPGETIAIVGPSGGGKSTLCNLIPRFYDVGEGSITIDGHDVRDVTQKSLRRNIGVVQQDVFLFAASIMENIRYGRPRATTDEVIEAAGGRRSTTTSWPCPRASTPTWASGGPSSPADRSSGSPSPRIS